MLFVNKENPHVCLQMKRPKSLVDNNSIFYFTSFSRGFSLYPQFLSRGDRSLKL